MFLYHYMSDKNVTLYHNYFTILFCSVFLFSYDVCLREYMQKYGSVYVFLYMLSDLLIFPKTMIYIIHHIFSMMLSIYDQYNPGLFLIHQKLLFRTEYSTIFLNLYNLTKKTIFLILFIISFFYFRVYKNIEFIHQKKYCIEFYEYPLMGLSFLNFYWAYLIIKKLYTTARNAAHHLV